MSPVAKFSPIRSISRIATFAPNEPVHRFFTTYANHKPYQNAEFSKNSITVKKTLREAQKLTYKFKTLTNSKTFDHNQKRSL